MGDNKTDEVKFTIDGNPGQSNTFVSVKVEKAINVINNPDKVENNYFFDADGEMKETALKEAGVEKPQGKKLGSMTMREMLKSDLVDTTNIQKEIMNYVSCIRPFVKEDKDKLYMQLWARILECEPFSVVLFDPGKQPCRFNRNLVANIMHYLDGKGFYKTPYNQSEMTRAVEGDSDHPVRKGFREYPDEKYCPVLDDLLKELQQQ